MNIHLRIGKFRLARTACALLLIAILFQTPQPVSAQLKAAKGQTDIIGPAGSGSFGQSVTILPNGNFVVTDPHYREGATLDLGAVYLYNGASKALISTLKGSQAQDMLGNWGITVLQDGNFLVSSPYWDNGAVSNAGAVTWCSQTSGCPASISAANSLVGSSANDNVGWSYIQVVNSSTYIISTVYWDNGTAQNAGAKTFCSTSNPCKGPVSAANSLVANSTNSFVGSGSIYTLPAGGFVVAITGWDNGAQADVGAVRFCSAWDTCYGVISESNSLVGTKSQDSVGAAIYILSNGDFLVRSPDWDDGSIVDAGAVTFCSVSSSCHGAVSYSNSLIGEHSNDHLSSGGIISLENGHYVILSPEWDRGGTIDAGAATYCGSGGCSGNISLANSLLGTTSADKVGWRGVRLYNGNYLVLNPYWDNGGSVDLGAATWCSGSGCSGEVTSGNSLVGSTPGDGLELDAIASSDVNNYMVMWPNWNNGGVVNAGAVKWCGASSGCAGVVDAGSSLVGTNANDQVGIFGSNMGNGKYAVSSYNWNGTATGAGAVTFCTNLSGCPGIVSFSNSLVGSSEGDHVGGGSYTWNTNALIFSSPNWDYGSAANAGALTFCELDYLSNCSGYLSSDNSLVGSHANDALGSDGFFFLSNGNYVVSSTDWNGMGAVTFCSGSNGCKGILSSDNSLVGSHAVDEVGYRVRQLNNSNYVIGSPSWDNGATGNVGAVTFCSGTTGCQGTISAANSLMGSHENYFLSYADLSSLENNDYLINTSYWPDSAADGEGTLTWCDGAQGCLGSSDGYPRRVSGTVSEGSNLNGHYDPVNNQVVVGRPLDNVVTILNSSLLYSIFLPMIKR